MKKVKKKEKIYKLHKKTLITDELVDSINDLLNHLSPNNYTIDQKRLRELLSNELLEIYLLEEGNKIIGMGSLHFFDTLVKKSAWIEDVVVHPDHRSKGQGKKIMSHVIARARERGVKHIDLSSRNNRKKAHKFYKKIKFEKRDTSVFRKKFKR